MKEKNYVALHNHSHYSTLDGYATIDEYIKAAKDLGMIGIGLTDHGTASGLYKFITRAQKEGLIPVPGIEFYVAPENPQGAKLKEPMYYGRGGKRAPKYDLSNGAYTHLTVFAYNNVGLSNLFKLTSLSWKKEHFYFKPRIDTNMLAEHSEGLIVTTGCPSSEVSRRFLLGQDEKAYEYASRMKSIFGDNYYVEIMNHKMEDDELERILVPKQIKLAKDLGIKIIATNDSHYAFQEDSTPHERVLAVGTKAKMKDLPRHEGGNRFAFSTPEYHIKTYDEMLELYPEDVAEEALENTIELTMKCQDIKLEYNPHLRPEIDIPEGYTEATYFQKLIYDGFVKKRGHEPKEIQEESVRRIREEFEVIHSNDFISYFLVVHDYINYAHKKGIGVGAGRGSVGGSEIAYVLDISNTDPIRFNLLFERFLSPGRGSLYQIEYVSGEIEEIPVSSKKRIYEADESDNRVVYVHELSPGDMVNYKGGKEVIEKIFVKVPGSAPDIDTDFHTEGRDEVVQYCIDKYGEENVANIITFGTFKAKSSFKAMCTIYGVPPSAANKVSSLIDDSASLKELMDPSSPKYNESIDFRRAIDNPMYDEVVDMAIHLENRISETGVHPCGVIISSQPLAGIIPTQVRQKDGKVITQWEYPELEALGLIKMDFLGLDLINTIQQTLENIRLTNESAQDESLKREIPNMREIIMGEMNDPETYKNLQEGNTIGIFQLGSPGVRELLRQAKPQNFMEIANITALYRPGPMKSGAHIQYANRKNGIEEVSYIHEDFIGTEVQEILEETFGLLIFQEQIMLIAGRYAGMTPYETDRLRSAIGKKKMDVMMEMKPKFVEGCLARGASKEAVDTLWETIEVFGQYGFNKSHSVSYAINIYQTIYLKTHYPREFMAAVIQQGFGNPERLREYIQEAVRMGLRIGPVDINNSQVQMASAGIDPTNTYDIVFGFSGVKNLNINLAKAIVKERNENGNYKSVADFVTRILKSYPITAAPLANLALAGAFDSFGVSRKLVAEKAKMLIDSSSKKAQQGASLFDMLGGSAPAMGVTESIEITGEDYDYNEKIKLEADRIGMFVSGHPTAKLGHIAKMYKPVKFSDVIEKAKGRETYHVMGTITQIKTKTNKSGNRSIAVLLDDGSSAFGVYLPKHLVQSLQKGEELERIREAQEKGEKVDTSNYSQQLIDIMRDENIKPMEPLILNEAYVFKVGLRGRGDSKAIVIHGIKRLHTAPDGSLPYEVRVTSESQVKLIEDVAKKHFDKNGSYIKIHFVDGTSVILDTRVKLSLEFIMDMENAIGKRNIITNRI